MEKPSYIDGIYQPGVTVYGTLNARLTWTQDNRIVLTTASGTPEAPVYTDVLNASLGELQKVSVFTDSVKFTTAQGDVRFGIVPGSNLLTAGGSALGAVVANNAYNKSGFNAWIEEFTRNGVKVSRTSYAKLYGITAIITVAFIAVVVAAILLFDI